MSDTRSAAVEAFNEGVRAIQAGDEDAAASAWERALELDEMLVPAIRNLIVHREQQEDWAAAAQLYERMLRVDPFDTTSLVRQATVYRRNGDYDRATERYERAISIYPYFRFWYHELATVFEEAGRPEDAETWRARAIDLDADEAEMAYEDGLHQLKGGNFPLAIAIFEAVIDELPANLDARLKLAHALQRDGRYDAARAQLDEAFELTDAARALVCFHRARAAATAGHIEDAIHDLELALDEMPEYGRAERLLERLRAPAPAAAAAPDASPDAPPEPNVRPEGPAFDPPNPTLPWWEQLGEVVERALVVESHTGRPGRVAVLLDTDVNNATVAAATVDALRQCAPELFAAARIYLLAGESVAHAGDHGVVLERWLAEGDSLETGDWTGSSEGMAIDRLLEAASLAVGSDGFNVVFVVGDGRVRSDQTSTTSFLRQLPMWQMVWVRPPEAHSALQDSLKDVAPNWTEIIATT